MEPLRIVAILAAFNEADIIEEVLTHLIEHGVQSYVIDNGSTDDTRRIAGALMGRGVIGIEELANPASVFCWKDILARKEALARELRADWFIHQDADEFRESPWDGVRLADAIAAVDRAGFNAIDFGLYDFWPTTGDSGTPERATAGLTHHTPGAAFNRVQIRCWKRTDAVVDLVSSGGHEAAFAGRRVFPLRFVLRHYPIRSDAHGRRKVFDERLPRFTDEERQRGWHIQYDGYVQGQSLLKPAEELTLYDSGSVRMEQALTDLAALERESAEQLERTLARETSIREQLHESERRGQELRTLADQYVLDLAARDRSLMESTAALERATAALAEANATRARAEAEAAHERESRVETRGRLEQQLSALTDERDRIWRDLQAVHDSYTWRWTGPARWLAGRLMRLRG